MTDQANIYFSQLFNDWCDIPGNQAQLAEQCEATRQAVHQWRKKIPTDRIFEVERITGIPCRELRPDKFESEAVA